MDRNNERRMTPEEAKGAEMFAIVTGQRDAISAAYVEAKGELAAWRVRWSDSDALEARLAELKRSA